MSTPVHYYLVLCSNLRPRGVLRGVRRTRGYVKRGLETDLNGQRRIPLRGRESRRSVQAQDPYDLPKKATAFDETVSRLKRVSARLDARSTGREEGGGDMSRGSGREGAMNRVWG